LDASYNRINNIGRNVFYHLVNLEHLTLANNNISSIENETFSFLMNLQFLDLSSNDLDGRSIRALQGIPELVALSLANNRRLDRSLHEFVASWSLKDLDVSGTGLCRIPAALAQSVKVLRLANNQLSVSINYDLIA
jgi:Leucine-rich repeat (LRR) protein